MSGTNMPRSEPKAINRTTAAARTPIPLLEDGEVCSDCSIAWPPTSTSSPFVPAD